MLQLFSTSTQSKVPFQPLRSDSVSIYFCGPTPYNYVHIGNLVTYLAEDIIIRTIRFLGYNVHSAMNFTDIDDKTIRASLQEGIPLHAFTQKYIDGFLGDLAHLRIQPADTLVRISEHIPTMQLIIQKLLDTDYAYIGDDGSIYYSIEKFPNYGDLAQLPQEGRKTGVRISHDEYEKEVAADFALWKGYNAERDGDNSWNITLVTSDGSTRVFPGRPGWHIECSACNMAIFGDQIDLHMGGIDNLFPHHQNEVAQTEACTHKTFSKYWIHMGHLLVENKKMAKSAPNFYTLSDLFAHFSDISEDMVARGFRLLRLQTRHRDNFNYQHDKHASAFSALKSYDTLLQRLERTTKTDTPIRRVIRQEIQAIIANFIEALEDDFNTPEALVQWYALQSLANSICNDGTLAQGEFRAIVDAFLTMDQILDLQPKKQDRGIIPQEIIHLNEARIQAKQEKDFVRADALREQMREAGYAATDTKDGSFITASDT